LSAFEVCPEPNLSTMKKIIFIVIGAIFVIAAGFVIYGALTTQSHSPLQKADYNFKGLDVKISYCRPYKKGRLIFGDANDKALVPYGKYWRLGANYATEISFSKNVNFAGKPISAGSYRMYAVPSANAWQISLNSELGKFGFFEPDYKLDVLKVDVPVGAWPETEQFTVSFSNDSSAVQMDFVWDKTIVRVPIIPQ
jgi:hypothetical protein